MNYDPTKHHRCSIRLKGYDYSQPGAYFITVVTLGRECLFGEIVDEDMCLNKFGYIVRRAWFDLPYHYSNIELGIHVIMPNHFHGIIILSDEPCRGVVTTPQLGILNQQNKLGDETSPLRRPTLGRVVAYFKYQSTKQINIVLNSAGISIWQRNYFEHIIRNENEYQRIHQYIEANPANWRSDDDYID